RQRSLPLLPETFQTGCPASCGGRWRCGGRGGGFWASGGLWSGPGRFWCAGLDGDNGVAGMGLAVWEELDGGKAHLGLFLEGVSLFIAVVEQFAVWPPPCVGFQDYVVALDVDTRARLPVKGLPHPHV